jgi:hypothetical protein
MYPEPKEYGSWHELTQCKSVLSRIKDERIYGFFEPFRKYMRRALIEDAAGRLGAIDETTVRDYIASIPPEWQVDANTRAALAEFIRSRATFLAENIVRILSSAKYSDYLL